MNKILCVDHGGYGGDYFADWLRTYHRAEYHFAFDTRKALEMLNSGGFYGLFMAGLEIKSRDSSPKHSAKNGLLVVEAAKKLKIPTFVLIERRKYLRRLMELGADVVIESPYENLWLMFDIGRDLFSRRGLINRVFNN